MWKERKKKYSVYYVMYIQEKPLPINFDVYFLASFLSHNGKDNLSLAFLLGKL